MPYKHRHNLCWVHSWHVPTTFCNDQDLPQPPICVSAANHNPISLRCFLYGCVDPGPEKLATHFPPIAFIYGIDMPGRPPAPHSLSINDPASLSDLTLFSLSLSISHFFLSLSYTQHIQGKHIHTHDVYCSERKKKKCSERKKNNDEVIWMHIKTQHKHTHI